jgi:hypothetical protein
MSEVGTFRTSRDARLESGMRAKAGVRDLWVRSLTRRDTTPLVVRAEAASRTMSPDPRSPAPHLSRNERISWSLNGFIR